MFFVSTFKNSRLSHTWEWEKLQRYFKVSYQILWMKKLIICKMSDKKLSLGLFLQALILKNGCSFLGGDGMEVEGLTVWVCNSIALRRYFFQISEFTFKLIYWIDFKINTHFSQVHVWLISCRTTHISRSISKCYWSRKGREFTPNDNERAPTKTHGGAIAQRCQGIWFIFRLRTATGSSIRL